MKKLIIIGAGEFGRELYWTIQRSRGYGTEYEIKGYIDDDTSPEKKDLLKAPYLGQIQTYNICDDDVFTCAIASPTVRQLIIERLEDRGAVFINILHETSIIHGSAELGKGVILSPFTVIGDAAVVGDYVVMNTMTSIGHDCTIGKNTCIMSHCDITGHTVVGERVFLAGGVRTVPGAKIGDDAYAGAGSVILRRVKAGKRVFGNPAKEI